MSTLTRIFIDGEPEPGEIFDLPVRESRHLVKVLRANPGDEFEVVTPSGRVCLAELDGDGSGVLISAVEDSSSSASAREIVLYQAVPKGKRMEVVIEKATEVGVGRIVPLLTGRSVSKPGDGNKLERWRRIAESAARQALREGVPEVASPVLFTQAVRDLGTASGVILHNEPNLPVFERTVGRAGDVALFVGPEGGWTDEELRLAGESGIVPAQMGPYRLRSETAGLVAVVRARAVIELAGENVVRRRLGVDGIPEGRSR